MLSKMKSEESPLDLAPWEPLVTITGVVSGSRGVGLLLKVRIGGERTETENRDLSPQEARSGEEQRNGAGSQEAWKAFLFFLKKMGTITARVNAAGEVLIIQGEG